MRAPPQGQASSRANPGLDRPSANPIMFSLFLVLVLLPLLTNALQLHHRILHPNSPDSPFFKRASIRPDDSGSPGIVSVPTLETDFEALTRFETQHVTDALLYQLALDLQTDSPWLISSVKAVSLSFPPLCARSPSFFFSTVPSRPLCQ